MAIMRGVKNETFMVVVDVCCLLILLKPKIVSPWLRFLTRVILLDCQAHLFANVPMNEVSTADSLHRFSLVYSSV